MKKRPVKKKLASKRRASKGSRSSSGTLAEVSQARTTKGITAKSKTVLSRSPTDYEVVLADISQRIADSRRRALAAVNQELVGLYWHIGFVIVRQQESADWGDAVVEQLARDLRASFPDIVGLASDNLWRMRKFFLSCREIDQWLKDDETPHQKTPKEGKRKLGTLCPQLPTDKVASSTIAGHTSATRRKLDTLSPQFEKVELQNLISALSWSHHRMILGVSDRPDERYFYIAMSARERWSVRELRRQIDSGLFLRYMSVHRDPEKCLPAEAESGDLLPFKDHYVLEFLGLTDEYSEHELRKAILANLRDFFLEFGRDLTFVGEEYAITVGKDTFRIDLLFFHRRLQCLVSVDLKIGDFLPEYVGKSLFYVAALDEQIRLRHEKPSIGLILCRDADHSQVRLALTPAAKKIGVATYETALPDLRLIRQRLEQLPLLSKDRT